MAYNIVGDTIRSQFKSIKGLENLYRFDKSQLVPYGKIQFSHSSKKLAHFVVSRNISDEDVENVKKYITSNWFNESPSFLISVTGGAQDFTLNERVKRFFSRGLGKAAQTTNAWIVTGGLDCGVMQHVGQVSRKYPKVPTIGIAPFNKVTDKNQLERIHGETFNYVPSSKNNENSSSLEPNHTHFILLDNDNNKYNSEIEFRTKLENSICHNKPLVLIVIEGGVGTFKTVNEAKNNHFPIIVLRESGRAANLICEAFDKKSVEDFNLIEYFGKSWNPQTHPENEIKEQLKNIIEYPNLVCYNPSITHEFDQVLLELVLKDPRSSLFDKVILSIKWNRPDILDKLFEENLNKINENEKHKSLINGLENSLLIGDRPELFYVFMKYLDSIWELDLNKLYIKNKKKIKNSKKFPDSSLEKFKTISSLKKYHEYALKQNQMFEKPITTELDLMIWTALSNKPELCKAIWKMSKYPIHSGLLVSSIFLHMSQNSRDHCIELKERAILFESFALGVLDQIDTGKNARKILNLEWGYLGTALDIAVLSKCKQFVSHPYCQGVLDRKFYEDIHGSLDLNVPIWRVVLTIIIFPYFLVGGRLIYYPYQSKKDPQRVINNYLNVDEFVDEMLNEKEVSQLKSSSSSSSSSNIFSDGQEEDDDEKDSSSSSSSSTTTQITSSSSDDSYQRGSSHKVPTTINQRTSTTTQSIMSSQSTPLMSTQSFNYNTPSSYDSQPSSYDPKKKMSMRQQLNFFKLPVVRMLTNHLLFIIFLIILTLIAGKKVQYELEFVDFVLIFWVVCLIIDELIQYYQDPEFHYSSISNVLDSLILGLFSVYIIFRVIACRTESQDILMLACDLLIPVIIISFLRSLQIFQLDPTLGPFLMMIYKMIGDIAKFFLIFFLFFVGFQISFILITRQAEFLNDDSADDVESNAWQEEYPSGGTMYLTFWAFVGEFSDSFDIFNKTALGILTLALYLLIGQILLQNLLIAMMADTYSSIRDNSDIEWKFSRYTIVNESTTASILPPPINLFELAWDLYLWSKGNELRILKRINSTSSISSVQEQNIFVDSQIHPEMEDILKDALEDFDEISQHDEVKIENKLHEMNLNFQDRIDDLSAHISKLDIKLKQQQQQQQQQQQ